MKAAQPVGCERKYLGLRRAKVLELQQWMGTRRREGRHHGIIVRSVQRVRQVEPVILIGVARFEVSYVSNS